METIENKWADRFRFVPFWAKRMAGTWGLRRLEGRSCPPPNRSSQRHQPSHVSVDRSNEALDRALSCRRALGHHPCKNSMRRIVH